MKRLDLATMLAMGLGVALMLQPWFAWGLKLGFGLTIVSTLAQIVVSHLPARRAPEQEATGS